MKKTTFILGLLASFFTFSLSAHAVPVWNYRIEPNGVVRGGKVKIHQLGGGTIRFKYKLQTTVGYKEDWIMYRLPNQLFSRNFYNSLAVGEKTQVGNFQVTRQSASAYLAVGPGGQFRVFPGRGAAWRRIEFSVRAGVRLHGNLMNVTNE
jgi:hypothetical protein